MGWALDGVWEQTLEQVLEQVLERGCQMGAIAAQYIVAKNEAEAITTELTGNGIGACKKQNWIQHTTSPPGWQ
ncbi:MAG: hypothetical protein HC918_00565 [Oscillatoriales cyanobacterium SM2_1_8]|nr:hypothetical protein [Oscillatoriales cyanobacterium SM2_1_8]